MLNYGKKIFTIIFTIKRRFFFNLNQYNEVRNFRWFGPSLFANNEYIEDIYFFEVNTKCGEKNQYFSRVRSTSENADIFTARDEIYLVFAEKK